MALQVPNLDAAVSTKASIKQRGIGKSVRMLLAGLTDLLRTSLGQPSIYLPLAGAQHTAVGVSPLLMLCSAQHHCCVKQTRRQCAHDTDYPCCVCLAGLAALFLCVMKHIYANMLVACWTPCNIAGLPGSMAFMQMTADELERYNSNHPKVKQVRMEPSQFRALVLTPCRYAILTTTTTTPNHRQTANRVILQQGHIASLTAHTSSCECSASMPNAGFHRRQECCLFWDTKGGLLHCCSTSYMQGGWRNLARAAYAAEHALFKTSPIKYVANITAPVLFCGADYDKLCPMDTIKRAVELTPNGELYAVACDHFELFTPKVCYSGCVPAWSNKQRAQSTLSATHVSTG